MDLISGSYPGEIYYFRRKPNNTFAAGETLKDKRGKAINAGRASAVAVADWNGNGTLDFIVGNIDGGVFLVSNEGTPQKYVFGQPETLKAVGKPIMADGGNATPWVADWDGDGLPDLLLGSNAGSVVWYKNIGTKTKPELAKPVTLVDPINNSSAVKSFDKPTRNGMRTRPSVADWNGDGRPDLLVGDFNSGGGQGQYHGWVWVYLRKAQER